jgi:hypothetical protein
MTPSSDHRTTFLIALGGTLTGLYNAVQAEDLVRTILLSAAGTVVSFIVTVVLKRVFRKWMR